MGYNGNMPITLSNEHKQNTSSMAECLPSICKALGSGNSTTKYKNKTENKSTVVVCLAQILIYTLLILTTILKLFFFLFSWPVHLD